MVSLPGNETSLIKNEAFPRRNAAFGVGNEAFRLKKGTTVRLWRDGVSDFSNTHENNAGSSSKDQLIMVGHPSGFFAPGAMDGFRIYSRTLTEEQIQELYNLGS